MADSVDAECLDDQPFTYSRRFSPIVLAN